MKESKQNELVIELEKAFNKSLLFFTIIETIYAMSKSAKIISKETKKLQKKFQILKDEGVFPLIEDEGKHVELANSGHLSFPISIKELASVFEQGVQLMGSLSEKTKN